MDSLGDLRWIAEGFSRFLSDPKIKGLGIRNHRGDKAVIYSISSLQFEVEFVNEMAYTIKVSNGREVNEEFQIPYIHSREIDYHAIFQNGCGLARRLTNSE